MKNKPFTYFSTFTGIGGFEIGIHNAYRATVGGSETNQETAHGFWSRLFSAKRKSAGAAQGSIGQRAHNRIDQRPLCVGYSEINEFASQVFERHFEGVQNYGDITKINAEELPDFDCLIGGFPCQAFSIAGKRAGFADTRGTLFFDLARILKAKRPRLFVFENVKGLLNHDSGNTFKTIISTLDELGYDLQWQVANSKNFGVPQNRERVIIVGHIRGSTRPEVFPIGASNANHIQEITRAVPQAQRVYAQSGIAPSVDTGTGGNRQAKIIQRPRGKNKGGISSISPTVTSNSFQDNNHVLSPLLSPEDIGKTVRTGGHGSVTAKHNWDVLFDGMKIRRLTPRECERLQAFPDDWTEYGVEHFTDEHGVLQKRLKPMSDTQRYKMAGNAVTTNVIQAIFESIFASEKI